MLHITNNDLKGHKGHGRSNKTFLATNIMKSQIFLRLSMIDKVTYDHFYAIERLCDF